MPATGAVQSRRNWIAPLGHAVAAVFAVSTGYLASTQSSHREALKDFVLEKTVTEQTIAAQSRALGLVG